MSTKADPRQSDSPPANGSAPSDTALPWQSKRPAAAGWWYAWPPKGVLRGVKIELGTGFFDEGKLCFVCQDGTSLELGCSCFDGWSWAGPLPESEQAPATPTPNGELNGTGEGRA